MQLTTLVIDKVSLDVSFLKFLLKVLISVARMPFHSILYCRISKKTFAYSLTRHCPGQRSVMGFKAFLSWVKNILNLSNTKN